MKQMRPSGAWLLYPDSPINPVVCTFCQASSRSHPVQWIQMGCQNSMRSGSRGRRRQWLNEAPTLPCAHNSSAGNAASLKGLPFDSVIPSPFPFRSICKYQDLGQGHAEFPFFPGIFPQDLLYCQNLGIIPGLAVNPMACSLQHGTQ